MRVCVSTCIPKRRNFVEKTGYLFICFLGYDLPRSFPLQTSLSVHKGVALPLELPSSEPAKQRLHPRKLLKSGSWARGSPLRSYSFSPGTPQECFSQIKTWTLIGLDWFIALVERCNIRVQKSIQFAGSCFCYFFIRFLKMD